MPAFSMAALLGFGQPALLAVLLSQLCLAVGCWCWRAQKFPNAEKAPRALLAPSSAFPPRTEAPVGIIVHSSLALSCLPLQHNVSLDLQLAGKSCAINPLGKAKNPWEAQD